MPDDLARRRTTSTTRCTSKRKTFLHGLLVVEDKLSMAHGLETRVPFLDNDLVDFAMRCPVRLKLGNLAEVARINENEPGQATPTSSRRRSDGKQILRDVMQRYIPEEVTQAEKQGFSAPDASWFKGESIDYVSDGCSTTSARIYEYLDPRPCTRWSTSISTARRTAGC